MGKLRFFTTFADPGSTEEDGGKGFNLKQLTRMNMNVPEGAVLCASFYREHYGPPPDFAYEDDERLERQCVKMREAVSRNPLPATCTQELNAILEPFDASTRFAVRSSSTFEDLAGAAFAGQHDTFLNIARDDIEECIQRCLASLWQKHAVLYRHHQGFEQKEASMAVVIQRMISGDVAGVAFSIDPVSGDIHQALVEANWGVGESVVGGEAVTDSWLVDTRNGQLTERRVREKEFKDVTLERGVERVPLVGEERTEPCLTDPQVLQVAKQSQTLMELYGSPQDMEWVLDGETLYIVQSRPQTTIPPRYTRDESAERFPEPLTPLTWSYVQAAFNHSLEHSLALMNIHLPTRPWFELVDHYVYGNQNAVDILALHRPLDARSFDELLEEIPTLRERYRWVMDLPQQWMRDLDEYLLKAGELGARDLDAMDCADSQHHFRDLFELADSYFRPNIAISMTQAFLTNVLSTIVRLLTGDELEGHDLFKKIIAVPETKTGQINREVYDLASRAAQSPALLEQLSEGGKQALAGLSAHEAFAQDFWGFIRNYGHREVSFDFYHPTWAEAPEVVLDLIYLVATSTEKTDPREKEAAAKREQLDATQKLYANTPGELHFFLQELIRLTLDFTFLDDLEHFQTTRLNLLARRAAGAFGRRIKQNSPLEDPYDMFFFTRQELERVTTFELSDEQLTMVRERKQAFLEASETEPVWDLMETEEPATQEEGVLSGVPGSPGECEGEVYLVHGINDFAGLPDGAILVARTTNPAWTPLFYKARGIITESGGPLSHGAVTARELGLPAVMCVRGCMKAFTNGERVAINGRHGTVKRMDTT